MKLKVIFLMVAAIFSGCVMQKVESQPITENPKSKTQNLKSNVLVELFTSEG